MALQKLPAISVFLKTVAALLLIETVIFSLDALAEPPHTAEPSLTLFNFDSGGAKLLVSYIDDETIQVDVSAPAGGTLRYDYLALPPRMVIDLPGVNLARSQHYDIGHPMLSAVRAGVHPNLARFVFDWQNDSTPNYSPTGDEHFTSILISRKAIDSASAKRRIRIPALPRDEGKPVGHSEAVQPSEAVQQVETPEVDGYLEPSLQSNG